MKWNMRKYSVNCKMLYVGKVTVVVFPFQVAAVEKEPLIFRGCIDNARAHTSRAFIFEATQCRKRTTLSKNRRNDLNPCSSTNIEIVPGHLQRKG